MIRICCIVLLVVFFKQQVQAQKQLIVLKGQKVLLRLYAGDDFNYKLKGSKTIRRSYINNLFDTAVMAHKDIVPFHKIDRVYFDQRNFGNVIGYMLVVGGAGYFLIDQFNVVVVNGDKANLQKNVTTSSAVMVGVGLPLMLIHKKSQKIGGRYRLLVADKGSAFYRPDSRNFDSFMPDN